jgi:Ca2+-dependent lipid-binding protein
MTTRQASDKVNPKIVLTIKFGKGKVALSKDIVVEDVAFAGTMRIRLKLMNSFPHVQTVDLSFLEKPLIDYVSLWRGCPTFGICADVVCAGRSPRPSVST